MAKKSTKKKSKTPVRKTKKSASKNKMSCSTKNKSSSSWSGVKNFFKQLFSQTKPIELIKDFKDKGVEFISLENSIDTTNPMGMLLFSMCAAFAEMERTLITERVKAGLYAAHKKGRKGGRPKALTADKRKTLKSLVKANDLSVTKICNIVGISRSVYYRAVTSGLMK